MPPKQIVTIELEDFDSQFAGQRLECQVAGRQVIGKVLKEHHHVTRNSEGDVICTAPGLISIELEQAISVPGVYAADHTHGYHSPRVVFVPLNNGTKEFLREYKD